jgi:hypothetical protein
MIMTGKYYINGSDAYVLYGIVFTEGTIAELLRLPKRKDGYTRNWPDENGTERDLSVSVYESRTLTLPMLVIGRDRGEFNTRLALLESLLTAGPEIQLDCTDINRRFRLVYREMNPITDLEYHSSGRCFAAFSLVLLDDYPAQKFAIS